MGNARAGKKGREGGGDSRETAEFPAAALLGRLGVVLVAVAILLTGAVRLRLAATPLERDEGEYAYAGRLILDGQPPYRLAYNMKFPGTYYAYSVLLATFGSHPRGIHIGLLVVNATSILLVYAIGRRLTGEVAAAAAAVSFAVLSINRWIMGVFAHATHFVVLAALAGLWLLLRGLDRPRGPTLAAAGALFGVAVLMKQHAAAFLPLAAAFVYWRTVGERPGERGVAVSRVLALAAGAMAPVALVAAVFLFQGVLGAFWFWTFRYASTYVSAIPLSRFFEALSHGMDQIVGGNVGFWILAAVGLVALWVAAWPRQTRVLLSGLLVASFLAVCPGLYFREHYFIVMLPAVSWLVGVALVSLSRWIASVATPVFGAIVAGALFAAAVGLYVVPEREYLLRMGPRQLSRERYGSNPFVESEEIARYIREHTGPEERIAVLGSEPQIYFYAERTSASGYIYMYPLMESQPFAARMQDEMIEQIEAAQPSYVVFAKIGASWLAKKQSHQQVLQWGDRFVRACYDVVGIADIHSKNVTTYAWDAEAAGYQPRSKNVVYVFRRKPGGPCHAGSF